VFLPSIDITAQFLGVGLLWLAAPRVAQSNLETRANIPYALSDFNCFNRQGFGVVKDAVLKPVRQRGGLIDCRTTIVPLTSIPKI
jgi:hypothetical protein